MSEDADRGTVRGRSAAPTFLRPTRDQVIALVLTSPAVFGLAGVSALKSWIVGALCAAGPQAWFAWRMTRGARGSAAQAARQGLAAEGGKFFLSAVAFALVFAVAKPTHPGLVFLGFGVLWLVQTISAVCLAVRPQGH